MPVARTRIVPAFGKLVGEIFRRAGDSIETASMRMNPPISPSYLSRIVRIGAVPNEDIIEAFIRTYRQVGVITPEEESRIWELVRGTTPEKPRIDPRLEIIDRVFQQLRREQRYANVFRARPPDEWTPGDKLVFIQTVQGATGQRLLPEDVDFSGI